ncbi:LacI family DNA-binding transcriptional regulator [Vibrio hippocampi]|uniref:Catabolite control protein A n=1 Tax=Vibrio hippocampi TaxID=654686 RepID=A0ABM8ZLD9_9VIBR|nr:substrate-binding domain-containing protein [Vibrio hippocampi]CAH0528850.1 Catabolite control protein A [Vibrio hippocampi]
MRLKKRTVSIQSVAKMARVSPATVSRFLNRTSFVSDEKCQKIEDAIKQLNYKTTIKSPNFDQGRSMTIGVLVQHPDSPYTCQIINDMERALMHHGYQLAITSGYWDQQLETHALNYLRQLNVDGIIIITGNLTEEQIVDFAKSTPVVAVGYSIEAHQIRCINIDNELAGYMATLHLLQAGHISIAHIKGLDSQPDSHSRFEGYKRALREAGIQPNNRLIKEGNFSSARAYQLTTELLDDNKTKVTAIFAANDLTAYGVIKAIHDYGLKVPDDISVVGFDDLPTSHYFTPGLTTLRQPIEELGKITACSILNLLSGQRYDERLPPFELIVRESTKSLKTNK